MELYNASDADISEVYSQPRVAQEAGVRGKSKLRPGWSLDLTMDDPLTGKPWDMGKREVRNRVRQLVQETKPFMLIGSPPCTMFSSLQNLKKYTRDPARFAEKVENAKKHIRFCVELYKMQIEGGRYFLHEHPRRATSWPMHEIMKL